MHTQSAPEEFAQHLNDVFRLFGPISLRRMFSGYGVFHDGVMFGLVSQETLYLKADTENSADFRDQGLSQFEYVRQGKIIGLSYYQAPEIVLEDANEAALWARRSFVAALRANASKAKSVRNRHRHET
ncbi:transcriptional regulator [Methylotenera oryzisoli]|uniref:Transcriptional regulator n=1 Tax=Methylotenera oryzisoli TaxID=2080758 RepID=A0A4Y9VVB4_9PROT|nr:TfoX/Sxy family protein [Methylotenera oryzisoli]TFW72985.1 transcriptional regulator [Methylotenera oryzisoli]